MNLFAASGGVGVGNITSILSAYWNNIFSGGCVFFGFGLQLKIHLFSHEKYNIELWFHVDIMKKRNVFLFLIFAVHLN